jgi:DNA-binding response OmpR family regulator
MPKKGSRTGSREAMTPLRCGEFVLDIQARRLTQSNTTHKLTPKECKLMAIFMRNVGQVLTREVLMKEVWDTDFLEDTRTLDVHVCWLRKKIEKTRGRPVYLRTVRRVGYCFDLEKATD